MTVVAIEGREPALGVGTFGGVAPPLAEWRDRAHRRRVVHQALPGLYRAEAHAIAEHASHATARAGDFVVRVGQPADSFFVVLGGELEVHGPDGTHAVLRAGDRFGERCVLHGGRRTATVVATTDVDLVVIGRDGLEQLLASPAAIRVGLGPIAAMRTVRTLRTLHVAG